MLGTMGPFMLVEQKILVLQRLFSRKYGAHTRLFAWGRSLVNTLRTTANPYCYGARSWSLSRPHHQRFMAAINALLNRSRV